jgi:5-dehydro-2-deoxygluconokinase
VLQGIVADCDLLVGTEEEIRIAGGSGDTLAALRRRRELTTATLVVKRGPMGCVVFEGAIPDDIEAGLKGPGFPVEVFNILGAGDAFMAGFLRGWLEGRPLADCCTYANACGAVVVSRHGCAPAMPSWTELSHFLAHGSPGARPAARRRARAPASRHHPTGRVASWRCSRSTTGSARGLAGPAPMPPPASPASSRCSPSAAAAPSARLAGSAAFGAILDERYGEETLPTLTGIGAWIARPVELPGSRPLARGRPRHALALRAWPTEHVAKCLVSYHRTIRPRCARRSSSGCRRCSSPASAPTASCWWR